VTPIYGRNGSTVGWLNSDRVIYDRNNRYRAFVENGGVYTYQGRHLGVLDRAFFRDRHGHAVAFMDGAQGGPLAPIPAIAPIPPIPPIPPIHPIPPIAPIAPIGSLNWSQLDWDGFLNA
jgi:hypothetical protein